MKKLITVLAILITLTSNLFAGEEKIESKILDSFKSKFTTVQDITWETGSYYYKAAFTYYGNRMFAYYSQEAELLGVVHYFSPGQLPYYLQSRLKQNYNDFWITNLLELSTDNGFSYYIMLENADKKIILKSRNGRNWKIYKSKKQNFNTIQEYLN